MRSQAILTLAVLLAACLLQGRADPDEFENSIIGNRYSGENGEKYRLAPSSKFYKGCRDYEEKLQKIYEKLPKNTIKEGEDKVKKQEKKKDDELDLPPEIKEKYLQEKNRGNKKNNCQNRQNHGNIRTLFSVNPQVPSVDQADFIAYEQNFIYFTYNQQLRIYRVGPGATLTQVYSENLPLYEYSYYLVVSNGVIGWIANNYNQGKVRVYLKYHDILTGIVSNIDVFSRQGYVYAARELNGQLTMVSQHYQFTDLTWESNSGDIYTSFTGCTSWIGSNYVRDIAIISLSTTPQYSFVSFYACDYSYTAMLSETGNWYISSYYWNTTSNLIIQKAPIDHPLQSQWTAIQDIYVYYHHRFSEQSGCELRIAGESYTTPNRLRLFRLGCDPFQEISNGGYLGPANTYIQAVRWTDDFVYVSFGNKQIIKYNAVNFLVWGNITQNFYTTSLYEYGKDHLIGLGYYYESSPDYTYHYVASLLSTFNCSFQHKMDYHIVPSNNNSYIYGYNWEGNNLYVNIDYSLRMVTFPIYSSGESEPFARGFYYLRVEVGTTDPNYCMIHPPISQCSLPIGQVPSKNFTPIGRVYKHWNPPSSSWPGNSYSHIPQRFLVVRNIQRYLVTYSYCQIQIRLHPNDESGGNLPLAPSANIDLCP